MNIAVLIKQVPDTETKIKIKPDQSGIEEGDSWKLARFCREDPYSYFAFRTVESISQEAVS